MAIYTVDQIRTGVIETVADIAECEPSEINDTTRFADDLGLDSLAAAELMVSMERKYRIRIPEEEFKKISSVNEAVAAIHRHANAAGEQTELVP
jgi:acyl carrier protein